MPRKRNNILVPVTVVLLSFPPAIDATVRLTKHFSKQTRVNGGGVRSSLVDEIKGVFK